MLTSLPHMGDSTRHALALLPDDASSRQNRLFFFAPSSLLLQAESHEEIVWKPGF